MVVILFAVATYFLIRMLQERGIAPGDGGQGGTRTPRPPRGPRTPPQIVPPDDDEDFLRDLDRKRRKNPDDSEG